MTLWESIWPSHNGNILNQSTNLSNASTTTALPTKSIPTVHSAATFAAVPLEDKVNLCPYSMVQPHPYGLDERVGWATYLEYI